MPNERGWLCCQTLGFWLGTWEGTIDRETAVWLRFFDSAGNLILLPEAAEKQAEQEQQRTKQERQRTDRLAAKLRELG